MGPKNPQHHDANRALAGALFAALENDDDLGVLIRVLDGPSEKTNNVLELRFVAPADNLKDMPE